MSDEQIILKFFEVFNNRDLDEMSQLLASTAEFYFPKTQPLLGKDRILKFLNHAAVHWTNRGLNRRRKPYENEGVTILEMENGKIRYVSDFFKDTDKF
jgi:ketosteroid isomerase-like protein